MPEYPPELIETTASAIGQHMILRESTRQIAVAALDVATPVLAEAIAQKIIAHMETHGPQPASPGLTLHATMRRAWRRHFSIAARIAAGAFDTREDQLRMAAEAIARGDFIACNPPEVPSG